MQGRKNTFSDFTLAMPRNKIWTIDRETFSTLLLMFSLTYQIVRSCFKVASIWSSSKVVLWKHERSIRNNFQNKSYEILMGEASKFQSRYQNNRSYGQVCWPQLPLYRFRKTNIIILRKCSNHYICLRFRSSWRQDASKSACLKESLEHKSREDVAIFLGDELQQQLQNMSWFPRDT